MFETKILSAEEARQRTEEFIKRDDSVLYPIMEKIKIATKKKQYNVAIDFFTPDYVIKKLENLGYKCEINRLCENPYYEISWK